MAPVALEVHDLTKAYGGTLALANVDFEVAVGEIHGLCGENGAGKSTFVRQVAGIEKPDRGEINLFGTKMPRRYGQVDAARQGCSFIHQDLGLVPSLSVADNIALTVGYAVRRGFIDKAQTETLAEQALERLGLAINPRKMVQELPLAERAQVAIARAIAQDARLIFLDEPTASLQAREAKALFVTLEQLRNHQVACVLITHRIDEILAWCDRVTVLRDGRNVTTVQTSSLTREHLISLMLGRDADEVDSAPTHGTGDVVLTVDGLRSDFVGPVSFQVRAGEIVGITGLADAGHLELAGALFGLSALSEGTMQLDQQTYSPHSPRDAVLRGVSFVPADRVGEGIAAEMTVRENVFMNPRARALSGVTTRDETRILRPILNQFDVRPPDPNRPLSTFSGGNQQKVVLAKWMWKLPRLMILCEPTAGVDAGAKIEIYRRLRDTCSREGLAVIVASSDYQEIAELCTRALILWRGHLIRNMAETELSTESVTEAVYHGH